MPKKQAALPGTVGPSSRSGERTPTQNFLEVLTEASAPQSNGPQTAERPRNEGSRRFKSPFLRQPVPQFSDVSENQSKSARVRAILRLRRDPENRVPRRRLGFLASNRRKQTGTKSGDLELLSFLEGFQHVGKLVRWNVYINKAIQIRSGIVVSNQHELKRRITTTNNVHLTRRKKG